MTGRRPALLMVDLRVGVEVGTSDRPPAGGLEAADGEPPISRAYRDAFVETALAEALESGEIRRLVVVGAQSDCCVRTTALAAAVRGGRRHPGERCPQDGRLRTGRRLRQGEQIIAPTNRCFAGLRYPDQECAVATSSDVVLV